MCEPDEPGDLPDPEPRPPGPSRRSLLTGGAALFAASVLLPGTARFAAGSPAYADTTPTGQLVVPMGMHVHGSFSEGPAGWDTQLDEARRSGVRVLWPTDHDWRMSAYQAPDVFHTAGLAEVVQGRRYQWRPQQSGAAASALAAATSTSSPLDPAAGKGALRLAATAVGTDPASSRLYLDGAADNVPHRTNIAGQLLRLQVLPEAVGPDAWGELLLTLSTHPATGGRPAGPYQLSYQFGSAASGITTVGLLAVVTVPVVAGQWNEVVLTPAADVAAAWPDLVAADNVLLDLWVGATSRNAEAAQVCFAYLRFERTATGDVPLQVQAGIFAAYAARYPEITVLPGLEVSVAAAHTNWFGGAQHLPDYTRGAAAGLRRAPAGSYNAFSAALVHGYGGLASLNHPFGSNNAVGPPATQTARRRALAARLIATRCDGVDVLEVGYAKRGGASVLTHLALWDALSRAGVWLTGNGVNDAHGGRTSAWRTQPNRFLTTVLAASTGEADLLAALRAGSAYVSEIGSFAGLLEINAGSCPMGGVSVQPGVAARPLTVTATQLPSGSEVAVLQGLVDHGRAVDPANQVVARLPATAFGTGAAEVVLDTNRSSYVRVELWTAGRLVAFSNPVWLLQEEPPVPPGPDRRVV